MFPSIPPVTRTLIILCVIAFLLQSAAGDVMVLYLALWPAGSGAVLGPGLGFEPWQIITYSFLHGSLTHLFFNMFALYMFGGEIERLFGARRFVNLYFISVIAAAVTQLIFAAVAAGEPYPTLGASGGIFGVLLAYGMYFPRRMIILLIPPIPLPARWFVLLYGLFELYLGVTGTQEGVAHFAHLGGMLGAFLVIQYWRGHFPFGRR